MPVGDSTFFFAWVTPDQTTFTPAQQVYDEDVISFVIAHNEGDIPTLDIVVRNPQIGLLNPGRLYWCWLAWSGPAGVMPLFRGRLIGIPTDLMGETVQLKFVARPQNWIAAKQAAAEALKTPPNYDRIWYPISKQDDPDTILEGWSSAYHVDRISLAVTASDILIGEDGTVDFYGIDPATYATIIQNPALVTSLMYLPTAFYESLKIHLDQPPLVSVAVQANVTWDQRFQGSFPVTSGSILTYVGEAIISDWPKTGASLGGGYSVAVGWAANADGAIQKALTMGNISSSYSWQNEENHHQTGDTMSISVSYSHPSQMLPGISTRIWQYSVVGIIDPYTVDLNGDPAPINIPAHAEYTDLLCAQWNTSYALSLNYVANRKRTEWLFFTLSSDTQPIITDPLVTEDTELISLSSSNLSFPELTFLNWTSVSGQLVNLGTMVFPNNPTQPGQTSTQICIQAGTAGIIEPLFSNTAGQTTNDNDVVWSSLGSTPPLENAGDWQRATNVGLGTLLIPLPLVGEDLGSLLIPGNLSWPPTGVFVNKFTLFGSGLGAPMSECSFPGIVGGFSSSPAGFHAFTNPTGMNLFICTQAGQTGLFHTTFNETPGSVTSDNTVRWTCIGLVTLPIGGWPGMTGRSSFFPTDRGQQSIGHLICRARAKLRKRVRAVKISWETTFAAAAALSCRMNASLTDRRIPGGQAAGKVIGYKLIADGDKHRIYGQVSIGCSIGAANSIVVSNGGDPQYVESGYILPGYQVYDYMVVPLPTDDVGYTPPIQATTDDGLVFPLTLGQASIGSTFHGSEAEEQALIQQAIAEAKFQARNGRSVTLDVAGSSSITTSITEPDLPAVNAAMQNAFLQGSGMWYELDLRPLTNGPFAAAYTVDMTLLALPKTIDLSAPYSAG